VKTGDRLGSPAGRVAAGAIGCGVLVDQRPHLPQRAGQDLLHVGQAEPGRIRDLGSAQLAAEAQRDDLPLPSVEARQRSLKVGLEPQIRLLACVDERVMPRVQLVQRLLARAAVGAEVVDEQVARDDDEPRADARLRRVVARPRLQRALEGLLREVLGVGAGAQPVGEEAVDLPDVLVVNG
jgi:hypothetical protein